MITAVIPTLNAAETLPACVAALGGARVVVVDGGSADRTPEIAAALGARVVTAPRGRGGQLAAGAEAALAGGASWLLLLHADTVLEPGWQAEAERVTVTPGKAGFFELAFDDVSPGARRVGRLANWRARTLGLPYGDQGLLISASLYREVGGIRPLPLMEDVDLARRLGRPRLVPLNARAVTSADRYRRDGWWLRPVRNLALLGLFLAGVPAARLVRAYR